MVGDSPFQVEVRRGHSNLRTAHHYLLLRTISFSRRQRSDHLPVVVGCQGAQEHPLRERRDDPRKKRLLFAGALVLQPDGRLPNRVVFGVMSGEENPGPDRPINKWLQFLLPDDLHAFYATNGYTEDSPSFYLGRDNVYADGRKTGMPIWDRGGR